jgi:hypothetical protein
MSQIKKEELEDLAVTVAVIEAQQVDHPGYLMDTAMAIVDGELKRMGLIEEPFEYFMEVGR